MKPLLIASFLFALALAARAAAPLSPEARADFAWFSSLGYPELKEAKWAEVWVGEGSKTGNRPVEYRTVQGFVTRQEGEQFHVLTADLILREMTAQLHPANPIGRVTFEPREFERAARQYLDLLKKFALTPAMWSIKDSKLGHRSQIFFMAYAAWQRGHTELAQGLYDQASHLPTRQGGKAPPEGLKFQDLLEQEMGRAAMWQAARLFTSNGKPWPENRVLPTRTEVLAAFMEVVRRFPYCHEAPQAERTAKFLEQMIAEDKSHPVISEEEMAKLPMEEQVRELVFRLRDQRAYQSAYPFAPDIFDSLSSRDESPANRLAATGVPAVPQLIAALSDTRFTRASYSNRELILTKHTLTIGDCATLILERIAGRSFRPFVWGTFEESPAKIDHKLLDAWWQEVQAKGEEQTLVEALSSGTVPPFGLARVLEAKYPKALEPALIAGLRNARDRSILDDMVSEFRAVNSTSLDATLLAMLHTPPNPEARLLAIQKLWDRQHPEALPTALVEFEKLPGSHAGARSHPEMSSYASFLADCGDSRALRALQGRWDDLPARTRIAVVDALPKMLAAENHKAFGSGEPSLVHRDDGSREAALQLLITALNDPSPINGMVSTGWPKSPRVCDVALSALHKIEPEVFPFTPKAGATQWDEEKAAGLKKWAERRTGKR
ncbi:HEAT repeat domain-containing protein [Verrucomicrobium sp. BvORR106]|uniref:HEAT repeat domain-containing protein n=1 Tax=Verrucomicrobium sp. BvORR106 TaxID=1403819 RepID=UPI00056DCF8D|nr:HEAT repeat domain-containing protein [Verrucomicrobium sp. BvORR106]